MCLFVAIVSAAAFFMRTAVQRHAFAVLHQVTGLDTVGAENLILVTRPGDIR